MFVALPFHAVFETEYAKTVYNNSDTYEEQIPSGYMLAHLVSVS